MFITCDRCVMDSTAGDFQKTSNGCNFCEGMEKKSRNGVEYYDLEKLISLIKKRGLNQKYDCLVGLSGGVDSAFVLHKALDFGLRPLVVHIDNGWNSALSQHNIEKLVIGSNVTFLSEILYWPEYKEHLKAMFFSNVVDLELLADNIMNKLILETAIRFKIKFVLNGVNTATEGIALPKDWAWNKLDGLNLNSIIKKHSGEKIKKIRPIFPSHFYLYQKRFGITNIPFLNYVDYSKENALSILKERYNFIPYKYKHYENVFTRFYQGYILPSKFGIDKRKMHLSALIVTGELSRSEAKNILLNSPYPSNQLLKRDKKFVCKKLNFSDEFLDQYTKAPRVSHENYATNVPLLKKLKNLLKLEVGFNK